MTLQNWLERMARANFTSAELMLQAWRDYCATCQAFDQSPTREEFTQWKRLEEAQEVK